MTWCVRVAPTAGLEGGDDAIFLASWLADGSSQQDLGAALTFHASFDNGADADFGLGDTRI